MKYVVIAAMLMMVLAGCNNHNQELQQQKDQYTALQKVNTELRQDLTARDEYVDKVSDSINAIYTSVENLEKKEASLVREKTEMESSKKLSSEQIRTRLFDRLDLIRVQLADNQKRLRNLQSKLASSKKQYAGLQKMVDNLKATIDERDKSIASLEQRVQGLEQDVSSKKLALSQRDSIIDVQHNQITTAYYIAGTRDELEKMGVIKKEGGFLWGLLGSTTTLVGDLDTRNFKPINRTVKNTIQVGAQIDEIIPKRSVQYYRQAKLGDSQSTLTISQPENFWKDQYLIIITDKPAQSTIVQGSTSMR